MTKISIQVQQGDTWHTLNQLSIKPGMGEKEIAGIFQEAMRLKVGWESCSYLNNAPIRVHTQDMSTNRTG